MFGRNRGEGRSARIALGFLVAIIVIGFACLAFIYGTSEVSKYEREADSKYREYATRTYGPKRESCRVMPILNQPNCVANADREAREYERQEQDLVAQRITAIWTKLMGAAAITGMLLSVLGIYLVWTTFRAAHRSNEIASDTAQKQLKAYIGITNAFLISPKPLFLQAVIVVRNYGQTPAKDVVLHVDNIYSFSSDESVVGFSDTPSNVLSFGGEISPGGKFNYFSLQKIQTEFDLDAVESGKKSIYIWGRIEYKDIYGECRHLHFRRYAKAIPREVIDADFFEEVPKSAVPFMVCKSGNRSTEPKNNRAN